MKNGSELSKHPNSRVVTLYRKESFLMNAQAESAPEFLEQSKQSIGSYWKNSYGHTIGSGLNFTEQKLLMPTIIDCEVGDKDFRNKVANYFTTIRTVVPYKEGRKLEIGLEKDNTKPLDEDNMPLDIHDYISYRHAIEHPWVAVTEEEARNNMIAQYYLFDPQASEDAEILLNSARDKALEMYLQVKKTPEKIDMLLTLLNVDPRLFAGKNATALKEERLNEIATKQPDKFVETIEFKNFDERYRLITMINVGVLKRIEARIMDLETGETIGHDMEEAIVWVKDKAHSERWSLLLARMQEAMAKPLSATEKAAGKRTVKK